MRVLILAAIIAIALPALAVGQTPEMATIEGQHIILKVRADDLTHLNDPQAWVAKLDKGYEAYADLVGTLPFDGEKITILSVEDDPGGWAVAGNPIKWYRKYIVPTFEDNINKGDWTFGIMHEISHDFDLGFDPGYENRWCWEPEFWANYKMDYAFPMTKSVVFFEGKICDYGDPKSLRMTDLYLIGETNLGYGGRMLKGGWLTDSFHSKFTALVKEVGWDTYKRVFRWYFTLTPDELSEDPLCKRSLFIRAIEEQSGYDLSDEFIDWGFTHLTIDSKDAKDAREEARLFHNKNWNADIIDRPIYTGPGEKVKMRVDVTEKKLVAFKKGLGTHPYSEIVYNIDGKYKKFESVIGVPGRAPAEGRWGSVGFEVVTDGKKIYESPVLRGGGMYKSTSLDINGVKELKLIVNDGGDGIWGDGCAWVDPKVTDASGNVTYLSDLKPVSAKQGYETLKLDTDIDGNPLEFFFTPCAQPVKIVGNIDGKEIEFTRGSDPEAYEYTFDKGYAKKGTYYVWLTINVGDSPITQHDLITVIVK